MGAGCWGKVVSFCICDLGIFLQTPDLRAGRLWLNSESDGAQEQGGKGMLEKEKQIVGQQRLQNHIPLRS